MAYMLLVQEVGGGRKPQSVDEKRVSADRMERMQRFGAGLQSRGILKASDSLRSSSEGVRLELREGKRTFSDGPFTESKEIIGGFFLIDVRTREEALAIASECPAAEWSTVEIREVGPCYDE